MSKGGGSKGTTTQTVQKADPWSGIQPYMSDLYANAANWFNSSAGTQYYPGPQVAEINPNISQTLNSGWQRSVQGSPLNAQADSLVTGILGGRYRDTNPMVTGQWMNENPVLRGDLTNNIMSNAERFRSENRTARGDFLGESNPYLKGMFESASAPVVEQFSKSIMPSLASQFSARGRTGSGAHVAAAEAEMGTLGRTLSNMSSDIYGRAYEAERGRMAQAEEAEQARRTGLFGTAMQGEFAAHEAERSRRAGAYESELQRIMQAGQMAPMLASNDYEDLERQMGIGEYLRGYRQDNINADMNRYNFERDAFGNKLQLYNALLQGGTAFGQTSGSSSQSLPKANPFASAAGGALTGAALGPLLGATGPVGALIGMGLGLFG